MNTCAPPPPSWAAVETLYRDLKVVERTQPGSPRARDLEAAVDLLLENRISSSDPRFLARDAVRRATFLRLRADEQHAAAAARRRPGHTITSTPPPGHRDRDETDEPANDTADPVVVDPDDVEDIVCIDDLADRIATDTHRAIGRPAHAVLHRLRLDLSTATIADELGISASTVLRTVKAIRIQARTTLSAVAA